MQKRTLVSFDWALKKLLRQKANYGILEGFLSELLRFDVTIQNILDSESNKPEFAASKSTVEYLYLSNRSDSKDGISGGVVKDFAL
jgi:hypothetical protein